MNALAEFGIEAGDDVLPAVIYSRGAVASVSAICPTPARLAAMVRNRVGVMLLESPPDAAEPLAGLQWEGVTLHVRVRVVPDSVGGCGFVLLAYRPHEKEAAEAFFAQLAAQPAPTGRPS